MGIDSPSYQGKELIMVRLQGYKHSIFCNISSVLDCHGNWSQAVLWILSAQAPLQYSGVWGAYLCCRGLVPGLLGDSWFQYRRVYGGGAIWPLDRFMGFCLLATSLGFSVYPFPLPRFPPHHQPRDKPVCAGEHPENWRETSTMLWYHTRYGKQMSYFKHIIKSITL